ncbi:hypothetical protein S14_89 [Shewanella sp. phage 1/4]|uniref:hypothetical protein n=1 Tax=Shewanella phage 1/4 TaxID=1458859 RepID=UPI0004F66684|nr:hypothetical protein S14_89 [Shewanella sp. phage 1/4]AHK11198.1 hypothetical protein S14_89 [Shewanella sp. phage 1/4]
MFTKLKLWWRLETGKDLLEQLQKGYEEQVIIISALEDQLASLTRTVKLHTRVDADVSSTKYDKSVIICSGRWKNHSYSEVFEVEGGLLKDTVDILRDKEKTHSRGYYDLPYGTNRFFGGL